MSVGGPNRKNRGEESKGDKRKAKRGEKRKEDLVGSSKKRRERVG